LGEVTNLSDPACYVRPGSLKREKGRASGLKTSALGCGTSRSPREELWRIKYATQFVRFVWNRSLRRHLLTFKEIPAG